MEITPTRWMRNSGTTTRKRRGMAVRRTAKTNKSKIRSRMSAFGVHFVWRGDPCFEQSTWLCRKWVDCNVIYMSCCIRPELTMSPCWLVFRPQLDGQKPEDEILTKEDSKDVTSAVIDTQCNYAVLFLVFMFGRTMPTVDLHFHSRCLGDFPFGLAPSVLPSMRY